MPVALVYHDVPHVVMLATPADLEDYAVGFTLSEGLVARTDEIRGVEVAYGRRGRGCAASPVAWERFSHLLQRRRNLTGRTGCGLCGAETAADAIRDPAPVPAGIAAQRRAAACRHRAARDMRSRSTPAPGACMRRRGCYRARASSWCARMSAATTHSTRPSARWRAGARTLLAGYVLITSRASYEMVQKMRHRRACRSLAALSAPTAFAVRLAERDRPDTGRLRARATSTWSTPIPSD